jgi:hypothetical protein
MKRVYFLAVALIALSALSVHRVDATNGESWGNVKGRIVWGSGEIPERKPLAAVAQSNDKNHCLSKGPILDEEWVINKKNKGVQWTFVWLAPKQLKGGTLPIHPDLKETKQKEVVIDQPCCMFVPHAVGMREGQVLLAKNSSPIAHNFKWTGDPFKGVAGNVLMPPGGTFPIKELPAGRFPILINCNVHSWMKGYVRVFDHPYFAVTDKDGAFQIHKAPVGDFRLMVWHGTAGWNGGAAGKNGQPINIMAGGTTDLGNIEFQAK